MIKKGFTLIELLIAIAILGIIAAITMAAINPVQKLNQANDAKVKADIGSIATAAQTYYAKNQVYPATASVATDPALVVAISPNNSVAITNVDVTGSGTLNALNATASVVLSSHTTIAIQLAAGTLIGTIVPEISNDGGTTWISTFFDDPNS